MTHRILCPHHKERTPSCVIYDDHYYCFSCGAHGKASELGLKLGDIKPREPEDIAKTLAYISSLPRTEIRGLNLPVDDKYYYVVWPDGSYYKRRDKSGGPSKYLCPIGHSKPLFKADVKGRKTLCIVEGEINALSLSAIYPPFDVVSPGSATEFTSRKYLTEYAKYDRFIIVADADPAGLKAAINLKSELLKRTPHVRTHLMGQDANDILVQQGPNVLRKEVEIMLGMSGN